MDEEALIVWQDVFDEILAGRSEGLTCPLCNHTPLEVTVKANNQTRISCRSCKKYVEGSFGN